MLCIYSVIVVYNTVAHSEKKDENGKAYLFCSKYGDRIGGINISRLASLNQFDREGGMVRLIAYMALVLVSPGVLAGLLEKEINVDAFKEIILEHNFDIQIQQGESNRVIVKGDQEVVSKLDAEVKEKTLRLAIQYGDNAELAERLKWMASEIKVKIITDGELDFLKLLGGGDVYFKDVSLNELSVYILGASDLYMQNVTANKIKWALTGAGDVKVNEVMASDVIIKSTGAGDIGVQSLVSKHIEVVSMGAGDISVYGDGVSETLQVDLMGAGDVQLKKVAVTEADVSIKGAGDIYLNVDKKLKASIYGSGDIRFFGEPELKTTVIGSGSVRPF